MGWRRVIRFDELANLRIVAMPRDRLGIDLEGESVPASAMVNAHIAAGVVHAEYTSEGILEGN
jgi:hypothetical protein